MKGYALLVMSLCGKVVCCGTCKLHCYCKLPDLARIVSQFDLQKLCQGHEQLFKMRCKIVACYILVMLIYGFPCFSSIINAVKPRMCQISAFLG